MRVVLRILAVLVVLGAALWAFGPYEPADLSARFDPADMGDDIDAHFAKVEAAYDDITPGTQKQVVWSGERGAQTPLAIYYVHGFSATSEEIQPVPRRLGQQLGANVVYTRLRGHGRSGDDMAKATVADWMHDFTEGLTAAKRTGERVVIISTSTGSTLVHAAAADAGLMEDVAGLIFVSPNYGLNSPFAGLIGWPAARYWLPVLVGQRRNFEPRNEAHGTYWTTEYPSVAVMPVDALVRAVRKIDPAEFTVPVLFHFAKDDGVVRSDLSLAMVAAWGADAQVSHPELTEGDDPLSHVIVGDAMSPSQTEAALELMLGWIKGL